MYKVMSQSLWNRAVSFDVNPLHVVSVDLVSIPLEQGSVFRLNVWVLDRYFDHKSQSLWNRAVSFD